MSLPCALTQRRARYYELTRAGRKRLTAESTKWTRVVDAVATVMNSVPEEGS